MNATQISAVSVSNVVCSLSFSVSWEQAGKVRFILPVGFTNTYYAKCIGEGPWFKPKNFKKRYYVVIDAYLQALFLCSQISCALMLVQFPALAYLSLCLQPYILPEASYPKCSLFLLPTSFWPYVLTCLAFWFLLCLFLVLHCVLFLVSLFSQPSSPHSTAPIPNFKPHEFLSRFLSQSSTAPAQSFISSASRFEKRETHSQFPYLVPQKLGKMWSLGYVRVGPHR